MPDYPVSIKGVVLRSGQVLMLRNDRGEWELPGGRLEPDETPEECVAREVFEETAWRVRTGPILDSWLYFIEVAQRRVFVVTYGCELIDAPRLPVVSPEHQQVGLFERTELDGLRMPAGYRRSIDAWYDLSGDDPTSLKPRRWHRGARRSGGGGWR